MAWFKRESGELEPSGEKRVRTEGLWVKCEGCRQIIWKKDLEENLNVCPKCEKHFRLDARSRLALLLDENEYETFDENLSSTDPLKFVDLKPYSSRLKQAQHDTGLKDAVINAQGKLMGRPVIASAMEYAFIGGSMGAVVGEMITRAIERAVDSRTPLIIVSASGGARMMEGVVSLMQLAKISAALARLDEEEVPYISVLTDPTTGGVTASEAQVGGNVAPGAATSGREAWRPRARTFSQAPQAVRSARGRRWDRVFPSSACAGRTLQSDKCDAFGLATDVHWLGNVSGTAAARAVLRIHSPPSIATSFALNCSSRSKKSFVLRNTNKGSGSALPPVAV